MGQLALDRYRLLLVAGGEGGGSVPSADGFLPMAWSWRGDGVTSGPIVSASLDAAAVTEVLLEVR